MKSCLKDIIYLMIILLLLVMLIILKIDVRLDLFTKENVIDIIAILSTLTSSVIFAIIIYFQNNKHNNDIWSMQKDIFNKELSISKVSKVCNIYVTYFNSTNIIGFSIKEYLTNNFLNQKTDKNVEVLDKYERMNKEIASSYFLATHFFDGNDDLLSTLAKASELFMLLKEELYIVYNEIDNLIKEEIKNFSEEKSKSDITAKKFEKKRDKIFNKFEKLQAEHINFIINKEFMNKFKNHINIEEMK